ncbi:MULTISPECIES: hypothetical protein [Moorena]|uniref:hypothetical protein n=1 Tax=Moorena TaxID=1155738 RepID=UPI00145083A9|nr:hypothetical protein [Moorena sp. SIO4A1]NEQ63838.1 hypothetical protein [Moorena sp. SIO4A1]
MTDITSRKCKHSAISGQRSAVSRQLCGTGHKRCDFTQIKQMVTCFIQKHLK